MDRAILTVSCGTRCAEALRADVYPLEAAVERAFPAHRVFRAFACRSGPEAGRFEDVLADVRARGFGKIAVAPLLLTPGRVFDEVRALSGDCRVSAPLLGDSAFFDEIGRVYGDIAREEDRQVLLMGHGSLSAGDDCYAGLRSRLPEGVFLACRQGRVDLESAIEGLKSMGSRRVLLMPLMICAGNHARVEMAGDGPESWESILRAEGFDVKARPEGMGGMPRVQDMFIRRIRAITA